MPILPPHPFKDLEDSEYWDDVGIQMRLKSSLTKRNKWGLIFTSPVTKVKRMNPFQHHGIAHLSPSAVNMFTGSPSAWVAKALLGHKFSAGAAAWRGIATEDGLNAYIFHSATVEEAVDAALHSFDKLKGKMGVDQDCERERERIERYVINSIDAILELENEYGIGDPQAPPLGATWNNQWEVGLPCRFGEQPDEKVEVIGYLDFLYTNGSKQTIVDLKTTARIPSEWQPNHAMQAAFYKRAHGSNPDVIFVYASPKAEDKPNKFNILRLDDETYTRELKRMKQTIIRMSKMLKLSDDPFVLAEAIPHDESSFYWSGEKSLDEIVEDVKTAIENTEEE